MYPQDSIGRFYNPGKFGIKTRKQVDQLLSVYIYINYHTNTHACTCTHTHMHAHTLIIYTINYTFICNGLIHCM